MVKRWIVATGVAAMVVLTGIGAGAAPTRSDVRLFADGSTVAGAWSTLTTTGSGATMTLHTNGLTPGDAFTVLWVVFNAPQNCSHGEGPFRCGPGDLPPFGGDGSAQPSLLVATSGRVSASGAANIGAHLGVGDTTTALFGPGLTNPRGADVHLLVQDDGTTVQFSAHEQ